MIFIGFCFANEAWSQTEAPLDVNDSQDLPVQWRVGLLVGGGAEYMGSDDYQIGGGPSLSMQYGPFFLDTMRGLGLEYHTESGSSISAALNYDPGRLDGERSGGGYWRAKGSEDLTGMGKVKGGATIQLSASQQITPWLALDAMADISLTNKSDRGNWYSVGLTTTPYASDKHVLNLGLSASIADKKYSQSYFGVSSQQSLRSGYRTFESESGIFSWVLSASWAYQINDHWGFLSIIEGSKFTDKVSRSPIVKDDVNVMGGIGLSYVF